MTAEKAGPVLSLIFINWRRGAPVCGPCDLLAPRWLAEPQAHLLFAVACREEQVR
jgi:hypothetical protein